jgi:hypothetical protein
MATEATLAHFYHIDLLIEASTTVKTSPKLDDLLSIKISSLFLLMRISTPFDPESSCTLPLTCKASQACSIINPGRIASCVVGGPGTMQPFRQKWRPKLDVYSMESSNERKHNTHTGTVF